MITLKNKKSGALLKIKESDYKVLEEQGKLKHYETVEVAVSEAVVEAVAENKATKTKKVEE